MNRNSLNMIVQGKVVVITNTSSKVTLTNFTNEESIIANIQEVIPLKFKSLEDDIQSGDVVIRKVSLSGSYDGSESVDAIALTGDLLTHSITIEDHMFLIVEDD
jgi:hypothetical protein